MVSSPRPIAPNSVCLLFSGKRKSGKDYTVNKLCHQLVQEDIPHLVIHISHPIKHQYAQAHDLNFGELLTSGPYKENYRAQMVEWVEQQIRTDPYLFSRQALFDSLKSCPDPNLLARLVVVSDARRPSDLAFFTSQFGRSQCLLIRIWASVQTRVERGWQFIDGIDNAPTECALDSVQDWDLVVPNDGDDQILLATIQNIISKVKEMLNFEPA